MQEINVTGILSAVREEVLDSLPLWENLQSSEIELDILPPPVNVSSSKVGGTPIAYTNSGFKTAQQSEADLKRYQRLLRWKVAELPWNEGEKTLYQHVL